MKLFYCDVPYGNFGDDLNMFLWPKLLPGAFDGSVRFWPQEKKVVDRDDPADTLFVGIGTLLIDKMPAGGHKLVFGSGTGKTNHPAIDSRWDIQCVRGPLTAEALGLDPAMAIADPAILVRLLPSPAREKSYRTSFMPHWCQAQSGVWQKICRMTNIHFIDPRWQPAKVLEDIAASDFMISEALHGAIVADALRVPWVAVSSKHHIQDFKWRDWCLSVGLDYAPRAIPAIWTPRPGISGQMITAAKMAQGAMALLRLRSCAHLSKERIIEDLTQRLVDKLETFSRQRHLALELNPQF
ncbi:succinoglycan biosynthesis protein ExoV [Rhizomicrobium palustre]|uniref:Succinoglycan biosynthesis protein ExoV n=1 Tax=Rhizomicrobium palustre TaxID=189966 RepID=A0A846N1U2_9PROT|nr:polysaccharide pyruvyl transferase family protein [Rhizomicrobium palustre]NIK89944.1 succinoglycan biosynthesis protein ExoV [Rhizomicrobium palustre]